MRATPSEPEVSAAIQALRRLHGAEVSTSSAPRTIWHQGGPNADLLSTEQAQGQLTRQEFTLFQDYFLWTPTEGLRTGRLADESSAAGIKATPTLQFDRDPSAERLKRALAGLRAHPSEDAYLQHLTRVLETTLQTLHAR